MTGGDETEAVGQTAAVREVEVEVPVRVCDVGGWTDTWFAERGVVCNIAVGPGVAVSAAATRGDGEVSIHLADYGEDFRVGGEPPEHRLLSEAVREAGAPHGVDVHLHVASAVPPGASLGTSASVCVAVIAALDALRGPIRAPGELARAAHRVETARLARQSGVQDQIAATHGGANLVHIGRYPDADVRPLALAPALVRSLDEHLAHVAYGAGHDSSAVHEEVIDELQREGPASPRLEYLRILAGEAADALRAADLDRYGRALAAATDAQAALHPALVSRAAAELIDVARSIGAVGWKVNGAGGAGGSISVLCRGRADRDRVLDEAGRLGHTGLALSLSSAGARIVGPRGDRRSVERSGR